MVSSLGPILRVVWWTAWTTHSPSGWISLLFRIHIAILNSPLGYGVFCLFGDFSTGYLQVLAALDVDLSLLLRFGAYSGFAVDT